MIICNVNNSQPTLAGYKTNTSNTTRFHLYLNRTVGLFQCAGDMFAKSSDYFNSFQNVYLVCYVI